MITFFNLCLSFLLLYPISVIGFTFLDEGAHPGGTVQVKDHSSPPSWLVNAVKNWMSDVPGSTKLSTISIPGTHDSAAITENIFCETQAWSIPDQLEAGIRYLDIRTRRYMTSFMIHHGDCFLELKFEDVLHLVTQFLSKHPSETILMRVKEEHIPKENSESMSEIWNRYMVSYGGWFAKQIRAGTVPTLGQVRGKIVVLRDFNSNNRFGDGYGMIYRQSGGSTNIQDYYWVGFEGVVDIKPVTIDEKKSKIKEYINRASKSSKIVLNHLSAVGIPIYFPFNVAKETNLEAYKLLRSSHKKRSVGVLIMDYPGARIVYRIIKTNFKSVATIKCNSRSWTAYSDKTFARFKMPKGVEGQVISLSEGAYAKYVFPKCHRAKWTDLKFVCDSKGNWIRTKGSWDADGFCISYNTKQAHLLVGRR